MRSIFTYARAATKVIDLLGEECGCKRETLRCSSRLESDLGVYGSDVYDLLEAMERRLHVDMSEFDSHDCISPEYMTLGDYVLMFVIMGGGMALAGLVNFLRPALPPLCLLLVGVLGAVLVVRLGAKFSPKEDRRPELRVRDLVRAVEAKRWVSPKIA
jgi:hypothetical protein